MSNPTTEFESVLREAGLTPGEIIADGTLHRCGTSDKPNGKNGWYIFHGDHPASGAYGDWRTGMTETWTANGEKALTKAERQALKARMERDKAAREEETARRHAEAREKAKRIWNACPPAPADHPYLIRKSVIFDGLRLSMDGRLVVPVLDEAAAIQSLQFIAPDGGKRFLTGGKTTGGFFAIKGGRGPLYVAEGFATAATVHAATGETVLAAFNAGNLEAVAVMARAKYPDREIIICADDDRQTESNPGLTKGDEAARRIGGLVAVPKFADLDAGTDFNDLAAAEGLEVVKAQLAEVRPPEEKAQGLPGSLAASRGGRKKSSPQIPLARMVAASYGPGNLIYGQGAFWLWSGQGVWERLDDRAVKQQIHHVAESEVTGRNAVDSILDLMKTEAFRADVDLDPPGLFINVLNGELHYSPQGWELRPHIREHYRTTQIPVAFDPEASAPRFEQFLGEVFHGDPDAPEKSVIICEALGYSLLASCAYEKFFLLIGIGANGKSVLLRLLTDLAGAANVAAVQPSQFDNRFQRAYLCGKLVNIVTEIAEGADIADAQLKAIVSGELTTAERKFQPPFDFRPFCTCWFGTNHMPHTRDFSSGMIRRAEILQFNRVFAGSEQDHMLPEKLKAELPGILNLALQGVAGVFERGVFTSAPSSEAAKHDWMLESDQVAQFAAECCEFGQGHEVESATLYRQYSAWGEEAGIKRLLNRKNFSTRMVRLGAELCRGSRGVRLLAGVRLHQNHDARVAGDTFPHFTPKGM